CGVSARQAGDAQDQAPADGGLRGGGIPLAQERSGNPHRLAAPRALRRRRQAQPRRHHVLVLLGSPRGARRGIGTAPRGCGQGAPVAGVGRVGRNGRRRGLRSASAGCDVALEPWQGPFLGAVARRACRRGRLRPPPGESLPARDDVQALAAGQAAGRVSIRPARDDRAVRARGDLRELTELTVDACGCGDGFEIFDQQSADADLDRYRRHGPDRTTEMLLGMIRERGVQGASVLDVGGGIGVIDHELLRAGAGYAVLVDASPPALAAARAEARRRGVLERLEFVDGDFVSRSASIDAADIVTLDRVVCCYPDVESLVHLSSSRARSVYGLVLPRDRLILRVGLRLLNIWF